MGRRRLPQLFIVILVAHAAAGSGCIHNHYYGYNQPVCEPAVVSQPGAVRVSGSPPAATAVAPAPNAIAYGSVCEVPALSGPSGAVTVGPGSRVVQATPRPSRVLVSEPAGEGYSIRAGRTGWRRTDPESIATTKVEGAIDGTATR
jgi:hypothetical protein